MCLDAAAMGVLGPEQAGALPTFCTSRGSKEEVKT